MSNPDFRFSSPTLVEVMLFRLASLDRRVSRVADAGCVERAGKRCSMHCDPRVVVPDVTSCDCDCGEKRRFEHSSESVDVGADSDRFIATRRMTSVG